MWKQGKRNRSLTVFRSFNPKSIIPRIKKKRINNAMCRKTYKLRIHIQSRLAELLPRIFIIVFLAARAFTYIFSFWPPCQFWKYGCPCAKRCCSIRHLPELRGRYWVWYGDLVGGLRDLRAIDPLRPPAIPLPKPPLHSPSTVPFTSPLPLETVQSNH